MAGDYKSIPELTAISEENLDTTAEFEIAQSVSSVLGSFKVTLLKIINKCRATVAELITASSTVKFASASTIGDKIVYAYDGGVAYPADRYVLHEDTIYITTTSTTAGDTPISEPTKFKVVSNIFNASNTASTSESATLNKRCGQVTYSKVINASSGFVFTLNSNYIKTSPQKYNLELHYNYESSSGNPSIHTCWCDTNGELKIYVYNHDSTDATDSGVIIAFSIEG